MRPKGYKNNKPRVRITLKDMEEYIILESAAKQLNPDMSVGQFLRFAGVKLVNDAMREYQEHMENRNGKSSRPSGETDSSITAGHGQAKGDDGENVQADAGSSTESAESGTGAS